MLNLKDGTLWQWDIGRKMVITLEEGSTIDKVQFYNGIGDNAYPATSIEVVDGEILAGIPNSLLCYANNLTVYLMTTDEDGVKTQEQITLVVNKRAKPEDYIFTDDEFHTYKVYDERLQYLEDNIVLPDRLKESTDTEVKALVPEWAREAKPDVTLTENGKAADAFVVGGKISNLQNKDASLSQEIAVERVRIDNLARAEESGLSTEAERELVDIRVGINGRTYENAGIAVRSQIGLVCYEKCLLMTGLKLNVDTVNKKIALTKLSSENGVIYAEAMYTFVRGEAGLEVSSFDYSNIDNTTHNIVYNGITKSLTLKHHADNKGKQYEYGDIILATVHMSPDTLVRWLFASNNIYVNDVDLTDTSLEVPSSTIGTADGLRIDIDTINFTVTHTKGFIFFDNDMPITIASSSYPVSYKATSDVADYSDKKNQTCRVVYRDRVLTVTSPTQIKESDRHIFNMWLNPNGKIIGIYGNDSILDCIYVDGEKYIPKEVEEISTNEKTCAIFQRIVCVGDSYTSGHISVGGSTIPTNEKFAWPSFLGKLTGAEVINCGCSGCNVLTWQVHDRGLPKAQATGKAQAYIIGLGLNDIASGTSRFVELGTSSDIGTDNQTYYGGMSKIIRELKTISPDAMIFCTNDAKNR